MVFTIPSELNALAYQNKAVVYDILFKAVSKTLVVIAGDHKHLGAKIGATLVLHTWGSAMTLHPHIHGIIPGGGLSADGRQWMACRPGFFLPVRVLSSLFRRVFLELLMKAYRDKRLLLYQQLKAIDSPVAFTRWLEPLRQKSWVVYAKRPFSGPQAVLAYLSRYTHRVAIANRRLVSMDEKTVTFTWKDYRNKQYQKKLMSLSIDEFIRRFLLHVLPKQFHRIRHVGLFANACRRDNLNRLHALLEENHQAQALDSHGIEKSEALNEPDEYSYTCPKCGNYRLQSRTVN